METGESEQFASFDDFYAAFEAQMAKQLRDVQGAIKSYELYWNRINPEPLISATFPPCLEKGRDISQQGPDYNNTGSMGGGLANAADSLMVIKSWFSTSGVIPCPR